MCCCSLDAAAIAHPLRPMKISGTSCGCKIYVDGNALRICTHTEELRLRELHNRDGFGPTPVLLF